MFVILLGAAVALTWSFSWVTKYVKPELEASAEWSKRFAPELAPGTKVRVARVAGGPAYPVPDAATFGLLIEATPSDAVAADSAAAGRVAASLVTDAFFRYSGDRPIDWVRLRFVRPDGWILFEEAHKRGPGGVPQRIMLPAKRNVPPGAEKPPTETEPGR
jgi:hypothetical protein